MVWGDLTLLEVTLEVTGNMTIGWCCWLLVEREVGLELSWTWDFSCPFRLQFLGHHTHSNSTFILVYQLLLLTMFQTSRNRKSVCIKFHCSQHNTMNTTGGLFTKRENNKGYLIVWDSEGISNLAQYQRVGIIAHQRANQSIPISFIQWPNQLQSIDCVRNMFYSRKRITRVLFEPMT